MLILSRKIGESIRVDDDVSITVLSIKGQQIRLGIEAPKEIAVHREEVYQKLNAAADVEESEKESDAGSEMEFETGSVRESESDTRPLKAA